MKIKKVLKQPVYSSLFDTNEVQSKRHYLN